MHPTIFHLFPKLPYDIRYMIWKEYYHQPQDWRATFEPYPELWFAWSHHHWSDNHCPVEKSDDIISREAEIVRNIVQPVVKFRRWRTSHACVSHDHFRVNWNTDYVWLKPRFNYRGIAFACNGALRASLDSQPTWLNNVQTLVLQAPFIGSTTDQTLPHYLLWGIRSYLTSLRKVVWAVRSGTSHGAVVLLPVEMDVPSTLTVG
ncbi:hypothetical protein RB213_012041 [Colletotrichum asianum]